MLDTLLTILAGLITLIGAFLLFGVTVFVHEFGHFYVARKLGFVVKTFSIGFGKAIWAWERDGIQYKISWIPFGGYVSLPQLDPEGMDTLQGATEAVEIPPIPPWKKIAVAFAGPVGNIIFATILAIAIWLIPSQDTGSKMLPIIGQIHTNSGAYASGLRVGDEICAVNGTEVNSWYDFSVETLLQGGESVVLGIRTDAVDREVTVPLDEGAGGEAMIAGMLPADSCIFGSVTPNSPAERAGLKDGDEVFSFNGATLPSWGAFTELVQAMEAGDTADLGIRRGKEELMLSIAPEFDEEYQRMMIGVRLGGGSGMPWMLYRNPLKQLQNDAMAIVRVLRALTTPAEASQAAQGLGGPIAIFSMLMMAIKMGLANTLGLIRFLNINLAIMNLLPLPVLDGGHIVFSLWEVITRRKVNVRMQMILIQICAVLLIGAMLLLSFKDVDRQFGVQDFFKSFGKKAPIEQAE